MTISVDRDTVPSSHAVNESEWCPHPRSYLRSQYLISIPAFVPRRVKPLMDGPYTRFM